MSNFIILFIVVGEIGGEYDKWIFVEDSSVDKLFVNILIILLDMLFILLVFVEGSSIYWLSMDKLLVILIEVVDIVFINVSELILDVTKIVSDE